MDTRRYIYQYSCLSCVFSFCLLNRCCDVLHPNHLHHTLKPFKWKQEVIYTWKNSLGLVSLCCFWNSNCSGKILFMLPPSHIHHTQSWILFHFISLNVSFKWIQEVILICKITPTLFLCVAYKPHLSPGTELNFIQFSYFIVDTRGNMHMENDLTLNYYNICQT